MEPLQGNGGMIEFPALLFPGHYEIYVTNWECSWYLTKSNPVLAEWVPGQQQNYYGTTSRHYDHWERSGGRISLVWQFARCQV